MRFFRKFMRGFSRFFLPFGAILSLLFIPFAFIYPSTLIFCLLFISLGTLLTSAVISSLTNDFDYVPAHYDFEDSTEETYKHKNDYCLGYNTTKDNEVERERKKEAKKLNEEQKKKDIYKDNVNDKNF